jgi:outer membrane protein assembly factor BamB
MKGSSVLIAVTIVGALVVILVIRYPWTTRPAPSPPGPSEPTESTGLPTVKESWSYHTGLPPWRASADAWRTPAVGSDGTIYALGENHLLALSPSGELKWTYPDSGLPRLGPLLSVLIADDGAVWGGTNSGWLIRITAAGEAQPQFGGPGVINQLALSPVGVLLVSGNNMSDTIPTTGYPKETRDVALSVGPNLGPLKSAAFGADAAITIEEDSLTSWPLNLQQPNWRKKVSWGCHQPAIAKDGCIYVACVDGMAAINADGSSKWSFPTRFPTPASIADDGTVFFAGIIDGNVYCFDPDGHLRWTFPVGKPVGGTPAISRSGVIYVGSQNGNLYALDSSGNPLWALKTKGEVGSPTIGPDGTVYVQSGDGMLHAIAQPQNGGLAGQWPKRDADQGNTSRAQ